VVLGTALARQSGDTQTAAVNSTGGLGTLKTRAAPDFTLTSYDGSQINLADLRGRAVVVNFWASWCVPCQQEQPMLVRVARTYDPQTVTFLGIGVWDAERDARDFMARYQVPYPGGADVGGRVTINWGVAGVPETFFVRSDGTLTRRWVGPLGEDNLRTFIEEIRPGAVASTAS
jgi:cytochrome c biogenesis protein CcmG/thiol:disulfide interchange protein DsbE